MLGRSLHIEEQLLHILDLLFSYLILPLSQSQHRRRSQQLHAVPQTCTTSNLTQISQSFRRQLDAFSRSTDSQDLHQLLQTIVRCFDDQQSVQQVDWNTVRRNHISTSDSADTSVGSQHNDGSQSWLQGSVQKCEALDIQHMDLIDEQNSRH